jgi:hypothetical protein
MKEQRENNPYLIKSQDQPYRMRLPEFLLDEEIWLGDAIKQVTYALGIRPSSDCGCERRASTLNHWLVFSWQRSR